MRRWPALAAGIGLMLFFIAFGFRLLLSGLDGNPFVTFIPAVMIAQLAGGPWAGIVSALAGGIAGEYFFVPPYHSFEITIPWGIVTLGLYAGTAILSMAIIETLHWAMLVREAEQERSGALFQELQHRTANNMAVVAALLRLQRLGLKDRKSVAAKALEAAEERIEILGRLHRKLYDPGAVCTPIGILLDDLCSELLKANAVEGITCNVSAPDVRFDLQRLLPIFFIVSEAVMNSIKYAFRPEYLGKISVVLQRKSACYELMIADDGIGRTDSLQDGNGSGLGSRIMKLFAKQLNGNIETFFNNPGTTVRVCFPAVVH